MTQNTGVIKSRPIFPFAQVTTILFIFIVFLLPFIFLCRVLIGELNGNLVNELEKTVGPFTILQADIFRIVPVSILALWSFFRGPVLLIRHRKMEPLALKYPKLTDQILHWETVSKLKQKPFLLRLPSDNPTIFAFGTWRHQYIAISDGALKMWVEPDLLEAVVLHEIGHIANGDTWKASFALEYVKWYFILLISEFGSNTLPFLLGLNGNGGVVYGIIFPLEGILEGLFFIIAVRYLFRLREFGADYYSWTNIGGTTSLQDALHKTLNWVKTEPQQLAFMSESLGNRWTNLLGFHPSAKKRLSVILDPMRLMDDVVGLAVVAGITLGLITTWMAETETLPALIAGMLLVGIPVVLLLLREYISGNQEKKLNVATYVLKVVLAFSTGSAIAWLVNVTPASLFRNDFNGNSAHLAVGGEFHYLIAYNLDSLLLIIVIMPILIAGLTFIALIIAHLFPHFTGRVSSKLSSIISGWMIELPGIILALWISSRWWFGNANVFSLPIISLLAVWVILSILVISLLHARDRRHLVDVDDK